MNIIGQWKLKKIATVDDNLDFNLTPIEEAIKLEEYEDSAIMVNAIYDFTPEGKMEVSIPLPEGMTKEELEAEGVELKNGRAIIESHDWKEDNGALLYDSGETREVCGETLSSWDKIEISGNIATLFNGNTATTEIEKI